MIYDLIIVGSGVAAYTVAKQYRLLNPNASMCIITQSHGSFYSKPMLSTVLSQKKIPSQLLMRDAATMAEQLGATIINETIVTELDAAAHQLYAGEQVFGYRQCVLAVGARPKLSAWLGTGVDDVWHINQWEDYDAFYTVLQQVKSIAIIGSGLVGCEFAQDMSQGQWRVDVLSAEQYPLDQLVPPVIGESLAAALAARGIHWHWDTVIRGVDQIDDGLLLRYEQAGLEQTLASGMVLSAVGVLPNINLAQSAALDCDNDQGILVDRFGRTSDPDVFALGDCACIDGYVGRYIAPILLSAQAVAKSLSGDATRIDFPVMPVVVKTASCPIACMPPMVKASHCEIEGESPNIKACYYNDDHQLLGFALSGSYTKERIALAKAISPVFFTCNS